MSIEGLESVFSRVTNDPGFIDLIFTSPEQTLMGFDLTADEKSKLKGFTPAQFETLAAASSEERMLFFFADRLDMRNLLAFENLYEHEQMIADNVRVGTYYKAILRYIKPGDVVIDLGTGSGILSFFAARQNAKHVFAVDYSDFIRVAEQIAMHNKIENITFVKSNSRDFAPPDKVDIIVHEQLGYALFNENMLKNVFDLKKRALKETGRILPGRFELYMEPASLNDAHRVPFIWERELHGIDFSFLKTDTFVSKYKPPSYRSRFIQPSAINKFLCKPEAILRFDMNEMQSDDELPRQLKCSKKVIHTGQLDGLCIFFNVIFDNEIQFDTSPLGTYTCWDKCMIRLEGRTFAEGDMIFLTINFEDITNVNSWSVIVE